MFGIGGTEILVILVVALIVFGPQKLPDLARTMGKAMGEFRRVSTEFQRTLNTEIATEEHEKRKKEAEEELFGDTDKDHEAKAREVQTPGTRASEADTPDADTPDAGLLGAKASGTNVTIDASTVSADGVPNPKPVASAGSVADNDKGAA